MLRHSLKDTRFEGTDWHATATAMGEMIKIGYQAQLKFNGRFSPSLQQMHGDYSHTRTAAADNCLLRMQAQFYSPCINKMMN